MGGGMLGVARSLIRPVLPMAKALILLLPQFSPVQFFRPRPPKNPELAIRTRQASWGAWAKTLPRKSFLLASSAASGGVMFGLHGGAARHLGEDSTGVVAHAAGGAVGGIGHGVWQPRFTRSALSSPHLPFAPCLSDRYLPVHYTILSHAHGLQLLSSRSRAPARGIQPTAPPDGRRRYAAGSPC